MYLLTFFQVLRNEMYLKLKLYSAKFYFINSLIYFLNAREKKLKNFSTLYKVLFTIKLLRITEMKQYFQFPCKRKCKLI